MLRHDSIPDPPVIDIVEKIEVLWEWGYKPDNIPSSSITIKELSDRKDKIAEELKSCLLAVIDDGERDHSSPYHDIVTENQVNLALRQIHDVGKVITGLHKALQGRDKTRGISKDA